MNELTLNPQFTKIIIGLIFSSATIYFVKEFFAFSEIVSKIDKAMLLITLDKEQGCHINQHVIFPIFKLQQDNKELTNAYFVDVFIIKFLMIVFSITLIVIVATVFNGHINIFENIGTISVGYLIIGLYILSLLKKLDNSSILYQNNQNNQKYNIVYLSSKHHFYEK